MIMIKKTNKKHYFQPTNQLKYSEIPLEGNTTVFIFFLFFWPDVIIKAEFILTTQCFFIGAIEIE